MDRIRPLTKIIITGPECSGKSWLCQKLAQHFNTIGVPEYARIYLEKHGPAYDFDTLEQIIHGHLQHQQQVVASAKDLMFLDTDLINFKVWEEMVFGRTHDFLEEAISRESDHRYLLTYPDLPWEADSLRENPNNRMEIFEHHRAKIEGLNRPYRVVRGLDKARLNQSIRKCAELMRE